MSVAWFFLNNPSKFNNIISGFFAGITTSLRPTFIILFVPFLITQRYSFLLGGLLGLLFSLSLSFTVVDIFIWKKYLLAMFGMTGFIDLNTYLPLEKISIPNPNTIYPKIVEGFNFTIRNPLEYNLDNTSLYDVLNAIDLPNKRDILVFGFIITMIFLSVYFIKYAFKNKDINYIFLYGTLMCLIGEFFIPVGRYSYYDIQMILPLLIIVSRTNIIDLISNKLIIFLLSGLLLGIGCFSWIPRFLFFSTFLIAFYTTIMSLILIRQEAKYKH